MVGALRAVVAALTEFHPPKIQDKEAYSHFAYKITSQHFLGRDEHCLYAHSITVSAFSRVHHIPAMGGDCDTD